MRFTGVVLAAAMMFTIACGGDDDPTGPDNSPTNGSLTASVDGSDWRAASGLIALRANGPVSVAGSASDGTTMSFAWMDEGPGTYTIPTSIGLNFYFTGPPSVGSWQALSNIGTGTVTVTTINEDRVAGTFQFTAMPVASTPASGQKVVTNGEFDVQF